jgi:Mn2+/Fe2+ NRAMP family transporter
MKLFKKIALGLGAVGPGLFLIGYNIGTGSITTMGMAGAQYGMTLLWALVLSGIFTYVLMVAFGQMTLVTGRTALFNIKHEIPGGKVIGLYVLITLIVGEILALMGIMGIVAELIQEGIRLVSRNQSLIISTTAIITVVSVGLFLILWYGRYKVFERILTGFVILMALCFIVVFFMVDPSYESILKGLIPRFPSETGGFVLIAAMAGTTCSAAVFIVRSTVIAEKGWTIKDLKGEKRDSLVSVIMMVFLSMVVMAVGAGTLHVLGVKMETTLEMIGLMEPIGGDLAAIIFIVGVTGAGLSTVFPIVLIAPWLVADYMGLERDIKSPLFRILIVAGLLFAFGSVFIDKAPPIIMVFSQLLQSLILPAVVIPAYYLMNKKELMGPDHLPGRIFNIGLIAVILFSLVTSYFAIRGLM